MKKPQKLEFFVSTAEDDNGHPIAEGCFSRDMEEEESMDRLNEQINSGRISEPVALNKGIKLLSANPDNLELLNFVACRYWALKEHHKAAEIWKKAYDLGMAQIPKDFKGRISWYEVDNRSFLRCCYGHLLGLGFLGKGKEALSLANKMLKWHPDDNQGVRYLIPDFQLMAGHLGSALKSFLKLASEQPTLWYSVALIAFRQNDFVTACTYARRGIAGNPYVAEALTGRLLLSDHLYWHGSNLYGTDFALDYVNAPFAGNKWENEETDFIDWVFNCAAVLQERAEMMACHEGLTYSHEVDDRRAHIEKMDRAVSKINDSLSKKMVRKVLNRWGQEIWPWDRRGLNHPYRN